MNTRRAASHKPPVERAALISLIIRPSRGLDSDTVLDELSGLVAAAGARVVLRAVQERSAASSATLIGKGKADEIAMACARESVDVVVVANDLTPAQARNLERALGRRVIDRTELILDIFARRARTREGKLQVELAQLQYLMPRLVGSSDALSRLGGGIGTRGPGETKLETDRRRIRYRVAALKRDIGVVSQRRAHLRARRKRTDVPTVALVGYTNSGKTTLFNLLTGDTAVASDALFVTLDPLVRRLKLPDARQVLISDTVGFIDRLPHQLVAAFRATLEEVVSADLLLHVIDAAAPDRERRDRAVRSVLAEIGAVAVPMVDVYNKCDLLSDAEIDRLRAVGPGALCVAAGAGRGRRELVEVLSSRLAMDPERAVFDLDYGRAGDRRVIAEIYRHGHVVSQVMTGGRVSIEADLPRRIIDRLLRAQVPA